MKDEIKEILDKLQKVANRETASRNALMKMAYIDYQLLLDYITNLQNENQRLNNVLNELEEGLQEAYKELQPNELIIGRIFIENILKDLKESDK